MFKHSFHKQKFKKIVINIYLEKPSKNNFKKIRFSKYTV